MNLGIIATIGYGILALVGGIIGYVQAASKVSLLSGSVSGLLLILAAYFQFQGQIWALILAASITGVLVLVFAFRLAKTRKLMPAGLMVFLGTLTLGILVNQIASFR